MDWRCPSARGAGSVVADHTPWLIFPDLWTVVAIATKVGKDFATIAWGSTRRAWSASSRCLIGVAIRFRAWVCVEWVAAGTVFMITDHASRINTAAPDVVAVAAFPVACDRHDG
jgi:hypothetical protein